MNVEYEVVAVFFQNKINWNLLKLLIYITEVMKLCTIKESDATNDSILNSFFLNFVVI